MDVNSGMTTATLLPNGEQMFIDANGAPFAGGFVYMYEVGTTTFKDTYQDENATILNENPVPLDSAGRCVMFGIGDYRQVLVDAGLNEIWDKVISGLLSASAIGDGVRDCLQASTAQGFMDCSGISSAIQAATSAISLMPGPTGPTGPVSTVPGTTGPTGPTGPAGADGTSGTSGFVQTGLATTTSAGFLPGLGGGQLTVTFPTPFPTALTYFSVSMPPDPSTSGFSPAAVGIFNADVNHVYCQVYDGEGLGLEDTQVAWVAMGY